MSDFNRTAFSAEKDNRNRRKENDAEFCRKELFNSANHLLISFEKFLDNTTTDEIAKNKEHIDNVYYHIGVMKALA